MENLFLNPGDKVAIVSTARKIDEAIIESAETWITKQRLQSTRGKNILEKHHQFAGKDEQRAESLNSALEDDSVKLIWFARGGYGSIRVFPYLNIKQLTDKPKLICGYSDITVWILQWFKLGIPAIHGTMPIDLNRNSESCLNSTANKWKGIFQNLNWEKHPLNNIGQASGILVGGNLSILYSLTGTKLMDFDRDIILFLEDLDEYLYHIDRMMQNLRLSGIFNKVKGVVIGGLTKMNDNEQPYGKTAEEIVAETLSPLKIPIAFGAPCGHLDHNMPLVMNVPVKLFVSNVKSTIHYDT